MPRSCPVCGSRKWRKDGVTGNAVCEDGHIFQDFRSENLITEPQAGYVLQKRRVRKEPKVNKRKQQGRRNIDNYEGEEGEWLKLQGMQVLLRYQVQALQRLWNLPDIFEGIVRDLWAYQLATSILPPMPSSDDNATPPPQDLADKDANPLTRGGSDLEKMDDQEGDGERSSSSTGSSDNEDDIDPEIMERLSELSHDGDDDEGRRGRDQGGSQRGGSQVRDTRWRKRRRLRVGDTVVTLIMGLWLSRVPVMFVEIERVVNGNVIPYLDFAHTTLLPQGMKKHMNRNVLLALAPRRCQSPLTMFSECRLFARTLSRRYGISIPEMNAPPVIWKTISAVGGSPTTYSQICNLLILLEVHLSLVESSIHIYTRKARSRGRSRSQTTRGRSRRASTVASGILSSNSDSNFSDEDDYGSRRGERGGGRGREVYEKSSRYFEIMMPELAVMSAWVMVMKMIYGLDGSARHVVVKIDPAIGLPDASSFLEELNKRLRTGEILNMDKWLQKQDFTRMENEEFDDFLEKAEGVLLKNQHSPDGPEISLFPLPNRPYIPRSTELGETANSSNPSWADFLEETPRIRHSGISIDNLPRRDHPLQPGDKLHSYDSADITGTLPVDVQTILEVAAKVVGVKVEDVSRVVEIFERRLERVRKERSRSRSGSRSRSKSRTGGRERSVTGR